MKDDDTTIEDGVHELFVYKVRVHITKGNAYLWDWVLVHAQAKCVYGDCIQPLINVR